MSGHQRFLALVFCGLLPLVAQAAAPVVDDSENFALLDDQQVALEQPVAKEHYNDNLASEEVPLAKEDQVAAQDNADLLDQVQAMRKELQELRGQIEVQAHDIKLMQQQQMTFYKDLDARIKNTSASIKPATSAISPVPNPGPTLDNSTAADSAASSKPLTKTVAVPVSNNPADEQISYLAAYDLVKTKRYDQALAAMQSFVNQYPKGGYTANAQYWLGELFMVKKNYSEAITHFEIVLKQFPKSNKAAASTLKIGYAFAASGKKDQAKQRLQQVMKNYPDTLTAQLAAAKLKSLNAL